MRLSPACFMNESNFKLMTGKTQGMRFRINPPKKAQPR